MRSLKFLIYNWRCWLNPEMGGAEVFTREIAMRWAKSGHQVTLFTSKFSGAKSEEIVDGVRIVRSGGRYSVYLKAKKFYFDRFRHEGFDVIIDEINTRPFFVPKFVNSGEKVVALIHQLAREYWFYETHFPLNYIGYHFLENNWLKNYIEIPTVTVSQSTKQDLKDLGFKRVFLVPEGLNFTPVSKPPEKKATPVIIYVGRLKRPKRPDHAIKAFKIIKQEIPEAELWILGDGSFKRDLERISGDNVTFFGGLNSIERRKLMGRAWVLINPSIREGWGLNVIEAAALGVPCVAYDVSGLRDSVKNEVTGLLLENGNIKSLAETIIRLLRNDALRSKLNTNALNYAKEFSWDKTAIQFLRIIRRLVNG